MDFFVVVGSITAICALTALRGWALSLLWAWFLVPIGLSPIGISQAIGVSLIISMCTSAGNGDTKDKEYFESFAHSAMISLVGVGIGWVVKQFGT